MIILHGFAASNYYNLVKHVLLYKEIPFQENLIYSTSDKLLTISPAGKVPAITTANGHHISESSVICDFIEEAYPAKPLYPAEAGERATVRQIMKIAELYLELPSRRLIRYALSGTAAPEALQDEVRQVLNRGIGAMQRLCQFSPWIAGKQLTMADIYVYYVNTIVDSFASSQLNWDILDEIPGMKEWHNSMSKSAIAKSVDADRAANMPEFMKYVKEQIAQAKTERNSPP
ncbi:glutathione S-transferase family protein [Thalassotalea litorea]|uniref:Glutathione S-transferase family protein n=1 Tax=Thalassotalea litorea TaxID=2020715 RepID=A0A5R9INP2_9GAMM|nr:glutathione S-transferase family protein [Thalassotalea litorea]TLU66199.1 glutathione S-transferase family protein [Thalassotalea litorea]